MLLNVCRLLSDFYQFTGEATKVIMTDAASHGDIYHRQHRATDGEGSTRTCGPRAITILHAGRPFGAVSTEEPAEVWWDGVAPAPLNHSRQTNVYCPIDPSHHLMLAISSFPFGSLPVRVRSTAGRHSRAAKMVT